VQLDKKAQIHQSIPQNNANSILHIIILLAMKIH